MKKSFLVTGALMGALGVMLGAFGAHGIAGLVEEKELRAFQTGVQYQFYHALALMMVVLIFSHSNGKWANAAGYLFIAGIILFSGSLYLISVSSLLRFGNTNWLGPVTPIGGLCFIAGWLSLIVSLIRQK